MKLVKPSVHVRVATTSVLAGPHGTLLERAGAPVDSEAHEYRSIETRSVARYFEGRDDLVLVNAYSGKGYEIAIKVADELPVVPVAIESDDHDETVDYYRHTRRDALSGIWFRGLAHCDTLKDAERAVDDLSLLVSRDGHPTVLVPGSLAPQIEQVKRLLAASLSSDRTSGWSGPFEVYSDSFRAAQALLAEVIPNDLLRAHLQSALGAEVSNTPYVTYKYSFDGATPDQRDVVEAAHQEALDYAAAQRSDLLQTARRAREQQQELRHQLVQTVNAVAGEALTVANYYATLGAQSPDAIAAVLLDESTRKPTITRTGAFGQDTPADTARRLSWAVQTYAQADAELDSGKWTVATA